MPDASIHLPLDWERKEPVIKLKRRLAAGGFAEWADLSPLYFVRMWCEWASNPEEWRPLNRHVNELSGHDWTLEDLTYIIEAACQWPVEAGGKLLPRAIEAGIYALENRGEISGLTLPEWRRHNEHLLPDFKSMQQRGGEATRMTTARKMAAKMAAQQREIFEQQGALLLTAQTESKDEQAAALTLIMQIDRHCGHAVRPTSQYSEALLRDAVAVIRRHAQPALDKVLTHLHLNRQNAAVVKIPERVLEHFDEYLAAATQDT